VFEPAASGRSKCRGCGRSIARGEIRFGENLPNLFGEGEMTLWFHLLCAAYKRPEAFIEAFSARSAESPELPERDALERAARSGLAFRRVPRIDGAARSPTSQARCRHCREAIERGSWRIRIAYYEEGRFSPGGFLHLACHTAYFEGQDVLDQLLYFSPGLSAEDREDLKLAYIRSPQSPGG
jgi:hypothetical protein